MNITLIGSTGRTGRYVLAEALRRGHRVTAFTRNAAALEARPHAVVEGDGRDLEKMRTAVADADAVISIINGGDSRDPHRAAEATRTVMRAMTETGVERLIVTTPYPIVARRPFLLIWLLHRLLATQYADARDLEQAVTTGDLDWTIVRLTRLTDRPATGTAVIRRELLGTPRSLTRADVATTLLDIVQEGHLSRVAVNVQGR
ncbi:Putative NADH-flavin reductase [Microbispora rosea]|uniref:Putative NADH-flavin reductase n=1 Tax=Microbispora rosea TaxID=58117 RepID=A0A1N6RQC4_9ACTN|nr:NAD(P)-binding oxidoreductase [Microbispora rosea]GIH45898.1 NADH-flavin reductase [Microbispora rosea subsp. rosea]SIQ31021.1 Putative NADH-flavin reductase [Microbispora rosea]